MQKKQDVHDRLRRQDRQDGAILNDNNDITIRTIKQKKPSISFFSPSYRYIVIIVKIPAYPAAAGDHAYPVFMMASRALKQGKANFLFD